LKSSGDRAGVNPVLRLAALRRLHVYVGMLIAPSILFFALSGAVQIFRLHEAKGDYRPLPVIEKLGTLHKDQVFAVKKKRPPPPPGAKPAAPREAGGPPKAAPKLSTEILKWWFLAVAIGLAGSTLLGLWMALRYNAQRRLMWILLLIGAAIPTVLAAL